MCVGVFVRGHKISLLFINSRFTIIPHNVKSNNLYPLAAVQSSMQMNFGDDPLFSIALPGGKLLCYTVQGEHGFSFNLINNEMIVMHMNSKFVPDRLFVDLK